MNCDMTLFDVYTLWPIEPVRAKGCKVWDKKGTEYLDLYGGHAVISIGHSHPRYVQALQRQTELLGFYSNSVENSLQQELAKKLGELSGYTDYSLFLCNSGAEANENALKLASFHTGKSRVIAFSEAFHGRTSGAVAVTDNCAIQAPFNQGHNVTFLPLNNLEEVEKELHKGDVAAILIEGIQGVAGIHAPTTSFLRGLRELSNQSNTILILDEIQSGYGRTGDFFAHQAADIRPDLITTAKGMGNGFPIGGVLISPIFEAKKGMLGTTFGGNHLACTAAIAVLDVMKEEQLIQNAQQIGNYLLEKLPAIKGINEVRGRGLMLGVSFKPGYSEVRNKLLFSHHIFTGGAKQGVMRLLPPLSINRAEIDHFLNSLQRVSEEISVTK